MRQVLLVFALSAIKCTVTEDIKQSHSPLCIVKYDDVITPCATFMERSLEQLHNESWAAQRISSMSYGQNYTNITLAYRRRSGINSILVVIRYDQFPLPLQTWEIQPMKLEFPPGPLNVTLAFAPNPENKTEYRIRRIVDPGKLFEDQSCNKTASISDCIALRNSKLFMRKSWKNTMSLSISSDLPKRPLNVEVLSAHCNITCSGDINPCSGIEIRHIYWEKPTEPLKLFNPNNETSPVHYCARISPAQHECCMIYTESVVMNPENYTEISIRFNQKMYLPEVFMVIFISLAVLISAIFAVRKIFGVDNPQCWPYSKIGSEESVGDGPYNNILDEPSPVKLNAPPTPTEQLNQPIEVLLVYHKDVDEIMQFMEKFRKILSIYVSKIWDPFDDEEIERVSENPSMWVEKILSREQVKVILVEDEQIGKWYELAQHQRPPIHQHHLDNTYLYILSILHNNPYLCLNYQRLFIVRFSYLKTPAKSTSIVPCTRYELPQNLGGLIDDLLGSYQQRSVFRLKLPLEEIDAVERIDRELSLQIRETEVI